MLKKCKFVKTGLISLSLLLLLSNANVANAKHVHWHFDNANSLIKKMHRHHHHRHYQHHRHHNYTISNSVNTQPKQQPNLQNQPSKYYLSGNLSHTIYFLNDQDLNDFRTGRHYGYFFINNFTQHPVKILGKTKFNGHTFYKVNVSNRYQNQWVDRHSLSHNPQKTNNLNISNLISSISGRQQAHLNRHRKRYLKQMYNRTFYDVNLDRHRFNLPPLRHDRYLNRLASWRSKQIENNFTHYNKQGRPFYILEAHRHHIPLGNNCGENIANATLGYSTIAGSPYHYHNQNGNDLANMDNSGMFYHDQLSKNGHRKNILNHNYTRLGVGVSYDNHQHRYSEAEEFGD